MKKIFTIFIIAIMSLTYTGLQAQIYAGLTPGLYQSNKKNSNALLGANLTGKYEVYERMLVGFNVGFYYSSNAVFGTKINNTVMPLTVVYEYALTDDDLYPYVGADIGFYRHTQYSVPAEALLKQNKMYFGFSPVVGINVPVIDNLFINLNGKFHYLMDKNANHAFSVNLGVHYYFRLKIVSVGRL